MPKRLLRWNQALVQRVRATTDPRTKRRAHFEESIAAARVNLAPDQVSELESAVPLAEVASDAGPDDTSGFF